jgi:hypothetical protein
MHRLASALQQSGVVLAALKEAQAHVYASGQTHAWRASKTSLAERRNSSADRNLFSGFGASPESTSSSIAGGRPLRHGEGGAGGESRD